MAAPTFDNIRLDDTYDWGAEGGPGFKTTVDETRSGKEQRNQDRSVARGQWIVTFSVKSAAAFASLLTHFYGRRGAARGFRFKDFMDYSATSQAIGTGNGATTTFQLVKIYADSINPYTRTIYAPVSGTVKIYVAAVQKTEGVDYTVSYTTGIITFLGGHIPTMGQAITADFEFDVPVRIRDDDFHGRFDSFNNLSWPEIVLVELTA